LKKLTGQDVAIANYLHGFCIFFRGLNHACRQDIDKLSRFVSMAEIQSGWMACLSGVLAAFHVRLSSGFGRQAGG
jgi:hypothetical protein